MKKNESEIRICKSKKCTKHLPNGYKYKYCESCRNKHAETAKNLGKGFLLATGTALSLVVTVVTKGKNSKK